MCSLSSNDPNSALIQSRVTPLCRFCAGGRHLPEACPRVAVIEYDPAGSTMIKRVEFHPMRLGKLSGKKRWGPNV